MAENSSGLTRVLLVIGLLLGVVAIVAGFWFMAPIVLIAIIALFIVRTRRTPTP